MPTHTHTQCVSKRLDKFVWEETISVEEAELRKKFTGTALLKFDWKKRYTGSVKTFNIPVRTCRSMIYGWKVHVNNK